MAITYPLTLPIDYGITKIKLFQNSSVAINESPWTYAAQKQVHQGQRWGAEISLPSLSREAAELWQCTLLQLGGIAGTFYLGDPINSQPRGNWAGQPVVSGASQTGQSLVINGLVAGATIEPGDMFQIGFRLYKYIGITTITNEGDASTDITLDIWPRLRESPADNEPLVLDSPQGIFRMSSNDYDLFTTNEIQYFDISLSAIEAL